MGYYSYDSKGVKIKGTDYPWLFTNGCIGLIKYEIPLLDNSFGEKRGVYTVRFGFAAPSTKLEFDIIIQDNVALETLNVLKEAGGVNKALIKEFNGINGVDYLSLELVPETTYPKVNNAPVINFIEVIREDSPEEAEPSEELNNLAYIP